MTRSPGDPVNDALAIMTEWARDADEQSFLRVHVRSLVEHLDGDERAEALIGMITGLIILAGGMMKLQAQRTGVTVEEILRILRQRVATDQV